MKCVCGYEHQFGLNDKGNWQDDLVGDKEFIKITGSTFRITPYSWSSDKVDVRLYACPECGTVRMVED
jgi:acetone carboxylase gamma subunit